MESNLELVSKLNPNNTQLKFVIGNLAGDYEKAKEIMISHGLTEKNAFPIIFMPASEGKRNYTKKDNELFAKLTNRVLQDKLNVRVLPQLHKILGIK